jgi:Flp pilus assembly protein TadG
MNEPQVGHRLRGDEGAATLWMVFGTIIIFAVCGLVFDGGSLINGKERAIDDAGAAARAGAQALDVSNVYRQGGTRQLDPTQAEARAKAFLTAQGWTGTVHADATDVTVTITRTQHMTFLGAFGLGDRSITGTATARPQEGFAGP